jgi:peptidoglycan hydrolase-like protein with peptidoglycan-binding domain
LLSRGYGPSGLVSSKTGQPDGVFGNGTQAALSKFKASVGLTADSIVDQQTWQHLLADGLD